ncbi:MAG TPA: hypothetical protein VIU12_12670 [Chryseolinea sp.]
MSTTIDIIPTETTNVTFGQVIETSEKNINNFLDSIGVKQTIQLRINLHEIDEKYVREIQMTDKFEWGENEYVWFVINGIAGGTDAYCRRLKDTDIDEEDPWWILGDLELNNTTIENIKEKLEKSKAFDRLWYFRRSMGQSGIIALSYGLISAAVAELTKGILTSGDAWDHQRFPAESKDFLSWYFRPDKALNADNGDWAKRSIEGIEEDLAERITYLRKAELTWWQRLFRN